MAQTRSINPTSFSSNPYVQALVSTRVWTPGDLITYYLKPTDLDGNGANDLAEKGADAAIVAAYNAFAAVANIRVQQVSDPNQAVWIEQATTGSGGATHTLPYVRPLTSENGGNYMLLGVDPAQFARGGQWFGIVLHEIGHGLGLEHTHESGRFPGVPAGTSDAPGDNGLNGKLYSIMSYNSLTSFTYGTPATPMAFDIAAMQALYGANMTTATGNDSYVIPTVNAAGTYYASIWDAGGVDTISVGSDAAVGATIDLRAATLQNEVGGGGYLSSVSGISGGFTIANGVVIENAVGTRHADTITGNAANNILTGGGGTDTIFGLAGNDTLIAGDGAVRALQKSATTVNATPAAAAVLDGWFSLAADANIANATTIPHATARAVASGQPEWYRFTVAAAGRIVIDIDGASFDTEIYLVNAAGTQLASNDDSRPVDPGSVPNPSDPTETRDSAITYSITAPGIYYVRVERFGSDLTTANGTYTLHVSVPGASVTAATLQGSTLDGGEGLDRLVGGSADDTLIGGLGDDVLIGGLGADAIDGGDGRDTVSYEDNSGAVSLDLRVGRGYTNAAFGDTYTAIENIRGSSFGDYLIGGFDVNLLEGGGGDDVLIGSLGGDVLDGGAGTDFASYEDNQGAVFIDLYGGGGYGNAAQGDTYISIENLRGSIFGDTLMGDSGINRLEGIAGDDVLIGGLGADVLVGGDGSDTVSYEENWGMVTADLTQGRGYGNAAQGDTYVGIENARGGLFADTLIGDAGANRLTGLHGNDTLVGGGGADTFVMETALDPANNVDRILDFIGGVDKIELKASVFANIGVGTLSSAAFGLGTAATTADQRILYDGATGNLWYDVDGAGGVAPVLFATLTTNPAVTATDLIVVA